MMTSLNLKNLPAYLYAKDVSEICKPLFERFGIRYLDYCLFYNNGTGFILISDAKWFEHYFTSKFKIGSTVCESGMHLWANYLGDEPVSDAVNHYNYDYPISIFKKHKNYCEYFDIATYKGNHKILDFYYNNADLLDNFFNYFKFKAQKIIKTAIKQKFVIPRGMQGGVIANLADERQAFLELIKQKKYYLDVSDPKKYLTKRERDTLQHFSKGHTMKEIGRAMNISPRTVEEYLANIRNKFGVDNKSGLIKLISDLNIDELI